MVSPTMKATVVTWLLASISGIYAQSYSHCNPLQGTCPADTALGSTLYADFTKGAASRFLASGTTANIAYTQNGAGLTVAKQGDSPILASDFYFMFGRVDVVMQAAPGTGIVSSIVLQSDDLDEVDWEFLGGNSQEVQTNYFGKGYDATYNRAAFLAVPESPETTFNTYSLVWTASSITWLINGVASRTLNYADSEDAGGHFPQTPMQVKVGVWAGGDPSNSPGTIAWAGGETNYAAGPFTMYVKSITVQDYSTGTQYEYGDTSGSWQSIRSIGGAIGSEGPAAGSSSAPVSVVASAPQSTLTSIPIAYGLPSTLLTVTQAASAPTSTNYWAGTGYRVSSSSTLNSPPQSESEAAAPAPVTTTAAAQTTVPAWTNPWWTPSTTYSNEWWTQSWTGPANIQEVAPPTSTSQFLLASQSPSSPSSLNSADSASASASSLPFSPLDSHRPANPSATLSTVQLRSTSTITFGSIKASSANSSFSYTNRSASSLVVFAITSSFLAGVLCIVF